MHLAEALQTVGSELLPEQFAGLRGHLDPAWIEEGLELAGTATVRKRRLPAEQVVWLVIAMALYRGESIERVVDLLDLALPDGRDGLLAKSTITQARQRLTEEPLAYLFAISAAKWAKQSADANKWRELSLYGADGSTLRVPDSPENRRAFGGQSDGGPRGASGYPMVRVVALMALRSHILSAFRFADYHTGETTLARELWREVPDHSLTIVDKNLMVSNELWHLQQEGTNRHWLARARKRMNYVHVKRLGKGDDLVEVEFHRHTLADNPDLPERWPMRAIRYQRKGHPPSVLVTSLLDPERYPAKELIALYHERWELELGYDEVKTHLLEREECIRSRTPDGVRQELWGIALAYNLIRVEMERAAAEAGVEPTRISFVAALALIRAELFWLSGPRLAPGTIPKKLLRLRANLKRLVLPPRRPHRSFPRAVKRKMTAYARKRPSLDRLK